MNRMLHIGTVELVSLPDSHIEGVPAKIDTGADSSAIWASNMHENDGVLSFVLFQKKSRYYNGTVIRTKRYSVITVKNSFGHTESRYRVFLKVTIAGRTVRSSFSLANRENSKYPILIGKKTLQGKFLVDVSRKSGKEYEILMLSSKRTAITEQFAKNLERYGKKLKITYAAYDELLFNVGGSQNRITITESGKDIASFDLVHFKTTIMDITASVAMYLQQRSVPYLDQATRHFPSDSKLYQYSILADNGIPVSRSIFMFPRQLKGSYEYLVEELGSPFVMKDIHASKGVDNFLVKSKAGFAKVCSQAVKNDQHFIAQVYVQNDRDYRVLVFGARIALVIQRKRTSDKSHLNNTSRGSVAELVDKDALPKDIQLASVSAAKLMERQVAGVDFVQDKSNGLWYCLEVNAGPQLATGSFTAEKHEAFAAYLERIVSS